MFEEYWNAVWHEVQTGCTCVTIDTHGNLHPTVCVCHRHSGVTIPVVSQLTVGGDIYTVRMPSRIPALLHEFLEVMLFVIQPFSNTNIYSNPNAIKEQAQEHSKHAALLREIFDPQLIEQELKHKVFDPSGVFAHIGDTLKHHCAPRRDRAVEEMVQIAQQPGPEAFQAFRTCLELLELIKLVRLTSISSLGLKSNFVFASRTSRTTSFLNFALSCCGIPQYSKAKHSDYALVLTLPFISLENGYTVHTSHYAQTDSTMLTRQNTNEYICLHSRESWTWSLIPQTFYSYSPP